MNDLFNNREIATGIWLVIAAIILGSSKAVRESLAKVAKMFTHPKIAIPILLMAAYVGFEVFLCQQFNLWNISLLKDTLYWFLLSGLALLMNLITNKEPGKFFKETIFQCIGITAVLEFILNVHTLPLLGEIILLPVLCFLGAGITMSQYEPKYAMIGKLFSGVLSVLGLLLLIYVIRSLYLYHADLMTRSTLNSFFLPILLTLLVLPFLYMSKLVADYETFFVRLQIFIPLDRRLRNYVRWQTLLNCRFDLFKLARFQKNALSSNWELSNQQGVDRLINNFKSGPSNEN